MMLTMTLCNHLCWRCHECHRTQNNHMKAQGCKNGIAGHHRSKVWHNPYVGGAATQQLSMNIVVLSRGASICCLLLTPPCMLLCRATAAVHHEDLGGAGHNGMVMAAHHDVYHLFVDFGVIYMIPTELSFNPKRSAAQATRWNLHVFTISTSAVLNIFMEK